MQLAAAFRVWEGEWNLEEEDIQEAAQLYSLDYTTDEFQGDLNDPQNKLLLFLYAKRILGSEDLFFRKGSFESVLTGRKTEALEILTTIVETGERSPIRPHLTHFDTFVSAHPEWTEGKDVFVVFRDHEDLRGII